MLNKRFGRVLSLLYYFALSLMFSFWSTAWARASKCSYEAKSGDCRERLKTEALTSGGMQRALSKVSGLLGWLRVNLEELLLAQLSSTPPSVFRGLGMAMGGCNLLDELSAAPPGSHFQEATGMEVCMSRTQGRWSKEAWLSSSPGPWQPSLLSRVLSHSSWDGFCTPERG